MLQDHQKTAILYLINTQQLTADEAAQIYAVKPCYIREIVTRNWLAALAAGTNQAVSPKDTPMPTPPLKLAEPQVRPEHMSLYPTMDSIPEAIAFIEQQAPLSTANEIFSALMLYHNTLLKQLHDSGQLK